jgi:hypothetical protein
MIIILIIVTNFNLKDIECIDIIKRSDFYSDSWKYTKEGGIYWFVFEKI